VVELVGYKERTTLDDPFRWFPPGAGWLAGHSLGGERNLNQIPEIFGTDISRRPIDFHFARRQAFDVRKFGREENVGAKYDFPIRLLGGPNSEALLQTGMVVSSVSPQSGDLRVRFTVEDKNDEVSFSTKVGGFISRDVRFEKRMIKLLDSETGKPLWRTPEIEDAVCATPELIVCLASKRIPSGKGYTFGKASLEATTGEVSRESGVFLCLTPAVCPFCQRRSKHRISFIPTGGHR